MDYPTINREDVSFYNDTEVCNIGYNEGTLSDSRPYRVEVWSGYNVTTATIFISIKGLEDVKDKAIKSYLVKEHIIDIIEDKIYISRVVDVMDNEFLSINVPLEESNEVINKCLVKLKDYEI